MCVGVSVWLGWGGVRVAGFSERVVEHVVKLIFCLVALQPNAGHASSFLRFLDHDATQSVRLL